MQILTTPNSFLRHQAKKVTSITKATLAEIETMIEILKNTRDPKGVGLAATQVGLDKQIFILIPKRTPQIYINPEVVKESKDNFSDHYKNEEDCWLEGCLSIPRIWGFVDRPFKVTVKYQTLDKNNQLVEEQHEFEDMESAFVQHEIDHLKGILFTDHVLKQGGQLYREEGGKFHPISL
jgi:peptide deformylase